MPEDNGTITIAHTAGTLDRFRIFGLVSGRVTVAGSEAAFTEAEYDDALDRKIHSPRAPDVAFLSVHACLRSARDYDWLDTGVAFGKGRGPAVVATEAGGITDLKGKRMALPGEVSTATLLASTFLPAYTELHLAPSAIPKALASDRVDAAVLIDEAQVTAGEEGLHTIVDLGVQFAKYYNDLPLPISLCCVHKELDTSKKEAFETALRESIQCAMKNRDDALSYCIEGRSGVSKEAAGKLLDLYVHDETLSISAELRQGLDVLKDFIEADYYAANCRF